MHILDIQHIGPDTVDLFERDGLPGALKTLFLGPGDLQLIAIHDQFVCPPASADQPQGVKVTVTKKLADKRIFLDRIRLSGQFRLLPVLIGKETIIVGIQEYT